MDWTTLVLGIFGTIMTVIVAPLIASKVSKDNREKLDYWARYFIASAEVTINGEKAGDKRKEFVLDMLSKMGLVKDSNKDKIGVLIDGLCQELTSTFVINREQLQACVAELNSTEEKK